MKNPTLFLIQSSYANTPNIWNDLQQLGNSADHIVVMGDAILKLEPIVILTFPNLYCLSNEQPLLNDIFKNQIKILEYAQFADLVLKFEHCVSLK